MTAKSILADRHQARVFALSEAIEDMVDGVAYRLDAGLDPLVYRGAYEGQWASSAARAALCKRAAEAAVKIVLEEADLPAEVRWLHVERKP